VRAGYLDHPARGPDRNKSGRGDLYEMTERCGARDPWDSEHRFSFWADDNDHEIRIFGATRANSARHCSSPCHAVKLIAPDNRHRQVGAPDGHAGLR
jgi:hypothetical protein